MSKVRKISYTVDSVSDLLSGENRLRVKVLYQDGKVRALPPRFKDEASMNIYLNRWNPELVGRRS